MKANHNLQMRFFYFIMRMAAKVKRRNLKLLQVAVNKKSWAVAPLWRLNTALFNVTMWADGRMNRIFLKEVGNRDL